MSVDRHTTHFESCGCAEAEIEQQRELLNTAVVKLDSCYQDYKKYRRLSERLQAHIAELEAAVVEAMPYVCWCAEQAEYCEDRADTDARRVYRMMAAALKGEGHDEG